MKASVVSGLQSSSSDDVDSRVEPCVVHHEGSLPLVPPPPHSLRIPLSLSLSFSLSPTCPHLSPAHLSPASRSPPLIGVGPAIRRSFSASCLLSPPFRLSGPIATLLLSPPSYSDVPYLLRPHSTNPQSAHAPDRHLMLLAWPQDRLHATRAGPPSSPATMSALSATAAVSGAGLLTVPTVRPPSSVAASPVLNSRRGTSARYAAHDELT